MLSKAHSSQFSRALEAAGSALGERSPSPRRAKTLPKWIARAMFAFPCIATEYKLCQPFVDALRGGTLIAVLLSTKPTENILVAVKNHR